MKNAYPIVITRGEQFCIVHVPDFDTGTQGESIADAMAMARDVIGMMGCFRQDEGQTIPEPSDISAIKAEANDLVTLVDVDFGEYRRKYYGTELKQVRKGIDK